MYPATRDEKEIERLKEWCDNLQKKHEVLDQFVSRLAADVSNLSNKLKQHLCTHKFLNIDGQDICINCGVPK